MQEIISEIISTNPYKIVFSCGKSEFKKIVCSRKVVGGNMVFQLEKYTEKQVFHENVSEEFLPITISTCLEAGFKQINAFAADVEMDVKISKKGKTLVNRRKVSGKAINIEGNNRKKQYLLQEGMDIPVFVELGIFTKELKIVRSMYDKFKQINRFVEIVDDVLKNHTGECINIIDFGCGKSYLTFILYYYCTEIRKIKTNIVGLDLKEKVISDCSELAKKYGYENLKFELGDINGYKTDMEVDMVVTLHACDTATDFALYNAINWNAKYILSVPCCQHEVNKQIKSDKLSALTKYGIVKERTSALITDAIRGCMLESRGYKTDLMEFIDIAHSPKNILIRAIKKNVSEEKRNRAKAEAYALCQEFGIKQTLMEMLEEK